eukprot:TRINITY_DN15976_c0_g1_i1.p1 TRINITY_DN15976_c0_g1~~TRINITY_DN15976_c0_g1_i1.p1  ORF type:complete len:114 (-),score=38.60 TRINITY_DN15976_c0_g1_i1:64-372(-)
MAQGGALKKRASPKKGAAQQKKQAGITKRGPRTVSSKGKKDERQKNTDRLTKIINSNIEKEMIAKSEKDRKGKLVVATDCSAVDAHSIKYRKELKKKGVKRR